MRYLAFILLTICILSSCNKEQPNNEYSYFRGNWRLVYTIGGIAGWKTIVPKDTVILLQLNANNTFRRTFNGRTVNEGKYTIFRPKEDQELIVSYDSNYRQFISISKDTLYTSDHFPDGICLAYVKQ